MDTPHADPDQGADLEERQADGAAGGGGELGVGQADTPQGADQHIGHGGEPQSELVGAQGVGGGAVGEEVGLALLDAVLHLASCAIDRLIEVLCFGRLGIEAGDEEAGIGVALGAFGLGDDPAPAAPAIERTPHELLEAPRRPAGGVALLGSFSQFGGDLGFEAGIAGQSLPSRKRGPNR